MLMFNLIPESNTDLRKTHCYKLLKRFHREHSPSEVPTSRIRAFMLCLVCTCPVLESPRRCSASLSTIKSYLVMDDCKCVQSELDSARYLLGNVR